MIVNKYGRRIYQEFKKNNDFEIITPKIKKIFYEMCKYYDFEGADADSIELFTLEDSEEDLALRNELNIQAKEYNNEYSVNQSVCDSDSGSSDYYEGIITIKIAKDTYMTFEYEC